MSKNKAMPNLKGKKPKRPAAPLRQPTDSSFHFSQPFVSVDAIIRADVKKIIRWKKPLLKHAILTSAGLSLTITALVFGGLVWQMKAGADPALGPKERLLAAANKQRLASPQSRKVVVVHKIRPVYVPVSAPPPAAFQASVSGVAQQTQTGPGLEEVILSLTIQGQQLKNLKILIYGPVAQDGSVSMSSSSVTLGPSSKPALYSDAA